MKTYLASYRPNGIVDADCELSIGQKKLDFVQHLEATDWGIGLAGRIEPPRVILVGRLSHDPARHKESTVA
jgi:hypothetical protein